MGDGHKVPFRLNPSQRSDSGRIMIIIETLALLRAAGRPSGRAATGAGGFGPDRTDDDVRSRKSRYNDDGRGGRCEVFDKKTLRRVLAALPLIQETLAVK